MIVNIQYPNGQFSTADGVENVVFTPNDEGEPLEASLFFQTNKQSKRLWFKREEEDVFAGFYVEVYSDTGTLIATHTW